MENIPRLTPSKKVYNDRVGKDKWTFIHQLEQKSIAVLKGLVEKYPQRGELVFDPFAVSLSTERACMLVRKNRSYMVSDSDEECFKTEVFAVG